MRVCTEEVWHRGGSQLPRRLLGGSGEDSGFDEVEDGDLRDGDFERSRERVEDRGGFG